MNTSNRIDMLLRIVLDELVGGGRYQKINFEWKQHSGSKS